MTSHSDRRNLTEKFATHPEYESARVLRASQSPASAATPSPPTATPSPPTVTRSPGYSMMPGNAGYTLPPGAKLPGFANATPRRGGRRVTRNKAREQRRRTAKFGNLN